MGHNRLWQIDFYSQPRDGLVCFFSISIGLDICPEWCYDEKQQEFQLTFIAQLLEQNL
jgi:hypothetical protein